MLSWNEIKHRAIAFAREWQGATSEKSERQTFWNEFFEIFGIELEEFPARIAEVALWLADHQANIALSEAFGQLYQRIPLAKSPHIHCANALRVDWKDILPPEKCSYILGNPPFVGSKLLSPE